MLGKEANGVLIGTNSEWTKREEYGVLCQHINTRSLGWSTPSQSHGIDSEDNPSVTSFVSFNDNKHGFEGPSINQEDMKQCFGGGTFLHF